MLSFPQTISKKLIIVSAAVVLLLNSWTARSEQSNEVGTITAAQVHVRVRPDRSSRSVTILRKGKQVKVLGYFNGWVKISYQKHVGYVRNREKYIHIIKDKTQSVQKKKHPSSTEARINEGDKKTKPINEAREKAEDIQKKIEAHETEVKLYTKKESGVIERLDQIELSLNRSGRRVSALKIKVESVKKKIDEIKVQKKDVQKEIKKSEAYASKRLVALYKLDLLGKIHVLSSADSLYDLMYRKSAIERILEYDNHVLENLNSNKKRLNHLLESLNEQKKEHLSLKKEMDSQIKIKFAEKKKRERILAEIKKKKSLELASIEFLKQAADALDQTIVTLRSEPDQLEKSKKNRFLDYKGLLKTPVEGRIITFFGPFKNKKFNVTNFRSGIEIKAERGEPIRTVYDGHVLFSSWFKGYGNMIIIDHGDNYYSVYAHAENLLKTKGDRVEMFEVIGTVGDSASMIGSGLYFEIRHHGKPMNPLDWLNNS